MSKKDEVPQEGGKVNWDKLERLSQKGDGKSKKKKKKHSANHAEVQAARVQAAVKKLSDAERSLPYPDEFLAEINLMRGQIDSSGLDLSDLEDDDGSGPDDDSIESLLGDDEDGEYELDDELEDDED
jgi:hypothetical protein